MRTYENTLSEGFHDGFAAEICADCCRFNGFSMILNYILYCQYIFNLRLFSVISPRILHQLDISLPKRAQLHLPHPSAEALDGLPQTRFHHLLTSKGSSKGS